jgi:hypothetical protein
MSDLVEDFMSEDQSTVLTGGMLCAVRAEILQLRAQVERLATMLEDSQSGFIPGSMSDGDWNARRDDLVRESKSSFSSTERQPETTTGEHSCE